ncbi:hypothetical protein Ciccas_012683 [Cichlidogyrus casuarinus]|uniref:Uncharacterized protein n=1 Tax=Cichlidogyrus casuarinus TaxID=1844966 RepID=A0ABD2PN65_9PLAT
MDTIKQDKLRTNSVVMAERATPLIQHSIVYDSPFPGHDDVKRFRMLGYLLVFANLIGNERTKRFFKFDSVTLFSIDLENAASIAARRFAMVSRK